MTPLAIVLGLLGLAWGVAADRISARWPEHLPGGPDAAEADGTPDAIAAEAAEPAAPGNAAPGTVAGPLPIRRPDWRTVVVAIVGGASLALVPVRFDGPTQQVLFGAWAVVLTLLLATDLDQRLLPDILTLPLVPIALVFGLSGLNPFILNGVLWPVITAVLFPAVFLALSIPFGPGAIGMGDLKLLVSVGLTLGLVRTFEGVVLAVLLSGLVVVLLLATRVIGRRSYIPYGPFLIIGTLWAALISV
jgi:leader peptidase (prepilin peptidase)/N-methyltransferase